MTGYGRGECLRYNRKFIVEIKSVNHRYSDINMKLPRRMNPFEDKLKKLFATSIFRGKTDVYVSMESLSEDDIKVSLNETLADAYVAGLRRIQNKYHLIDEISLSLIAGFQDVITVDKSVNDEDTMEQMWETLDAAARLALGSFIQMREAEGQALKQDIEGKLSAIQLLTQTVCDRAPFVVEEYRVRLKARLDEALTNVSFDENRILTEITLFADRACIDEELTRLSSHIVQMGQILNEQDSIGRKLDFLVQEMNREVNTIGSKSNDLAITKLVIDMKSEVEKIREQVQNIE